VAAATQRAHVYWFSADAALSAWWALISVKNESKPTESMKIHADIVCLRKAGAAPLFQLHNWFGGHARN
jgi:hypothetical protein